jgi:hypothetical protein
MQAVENRELGTVAMEVREMLESAVRSLTR